MQNAAATACCHTNPSEQVHAPRGIAYQRALELTGVSGAEPENLENEKFWSCMKHRWTSQWQTVAQQPPTVWRYVAATVAKLPSTASNPHPTAARLSSRFDTRWHDRPSHYTGILDG